MKEPFRGKASGKTPCPDCEEFRHIVDPVPRHVHYCHERIAELETELAVERDAHHIAVLQVMDRELALTNALKLDDYRLRVIQKTEAEVERLKDYLVRVGFSRKTADDVANYEGGGRENGPLLEKKGDTEEPDELEPDDWRDLSDAIGERKQREAAADPAAPRKERDEG